MSRTTKDAQLQIRISRHDKAAIQRAARDAGMEMSEYVLSRVLPASRSRFGELVAACAESASSSYALAELNSFLSALAARELCDAVAHAPTSPLTPFLSNYVAAMVEYGCGRMKLSAPSWTSKIPPLPEPVFGTNLRSLRLYLLTQSPAPFRARNLFIDATLGARV
jgi:hypothetical protein